MDDLIIGVGWGYRKHRLSEPIVQKFGEVLKQKNISVITVAHNAFSGKLIGLLEKRGLIKTRLIEKEHQTKIVEITVL